MTRVVHDVPPYMFVEGNPARVRAVNSVAVHRHGFGADALRNLKQTWRLLYRNIAEGTGAGRTADSTKQLKAD